MITLLDYPTSYYSHLKSVESLEMSEENFLEQHDENLALSENNTRALSESDFETQALSHIDALFGGALRLTRNQHDAEDLVQETYAKAFKARNSFSAGTNMRAWLFRIQHNAFVSNYRMKQRRPQESGGEQVEDWQLAQAASHSSTGLKSAEMEALEALPDTDIQAALGQLREDYREVVYLADVEGFSYKEIAEIMQTPVGTVMSRLHRGRSLLRTALEDYARQRGYLRSSNSGNNDLAAGVDQDSNEKSVKGAK